MAPLAKIEPDCHMLFMNEKSSIHTKLDEARGELLDLSLRNTLINYKPLKTRGVEVVGESPSEVYRILVQNGKAMSFLPRPDPDNQLQLVEDDEGSENSAQHTDNKLQTDYPSTELKKRLLNTYYAARTAIEEQGVNTLYLALGMLKWYEIEHSEIPHCAPLILIPVALNRTSVGAPFRVRRTEEEFGTNLSLQEKLKFDFGIDFPDFPDADDLEEFDIQSYYQAVNSVIDHMDRWQVDESAIALGFFSFAKFLMYRDLDPANWHNNVLSEHSVFQAVLGGFEFQVSEDFLPDDAQIDRTIQPAEFHHVVDADSSQTLAIHDVSKGHNLVIQGPPGTGKSQTITNLIAEGIANKKRVLFVAEKMAALEVVKRNLDEVNLGNACLEIHSHKTNKKAMVDELKQTLDLENQTTTLRQGLERLFEDRDRLNYYCDAVNTPIGESKITPYQAYGELLAAKRRLSEVHTPRLELTNSQHSAAQFKEGLTYTEELQTHLKHMGTPRDHLFWGSERRLFPPDDKVQVEQYAAEGRKTISELKDSSNQLARHLHLRMLPDSIEDVTNMISTARFALEAPSTQDIAVMATEWRTKGDDLQECLRAGKRFNQLRKEYRNLLNQYRGDLFNETWFQTVRKIHLALGELKHSSSHLAHHLQIQTPPDSLKDCARMIYTARYALQAPRLEGIAVEAIEWGTHSYELEKGLRAGEKLNQLRSRFNSYLISQAWEPQRWTQDVFEIYKILVEFGPKWGFVRSSKYRRACKEVKGFCKYGLPKTGKERADIVYAVYQTQQEQPYLNNIQELGEQLFGTHWQGENPNWIQLQSVAKYLSALHLSINRDELQEELVGYLAENPDLATLKERVSTTEENLDKYRTAIHLFTEEVQLPESLEIQHCVACTVLDEVQQIADAIIEGEQNPEVIQELGRRLFGTHWLESNLYWIQLQAIMHYLLVLHGSADVNEFPQQELIDCLASNPNLQVIQSVISRLRAQRRMVDGINEIKKIVDEMIDVRRQLESFQQLGKQLFGIHWRDESSDWAQLEAITEYFSKLYQLSERNELLEEVVDYLADNPDLERLQALVSTVEDHQKSHEYAIKAVVEKIELQEHVWDLGKLVQRSFTEQEEMLRAWEQESDKLHEIVTYNHLAERLTHGGFAEIVKVATDWPEASQFLSDLLKRTWYSVWVGKAIREHPILASFSSDTHEHIVDRFRQLDRLLLKCNRVEIAYEHVKNLPQHEVSSGQLSVLRGEFHKKRRHLPIRTLMTKAGHAIQTIKPVFMMSPLSVAKFLPAESVKFDWVIFDESSQVEPVDAFGAIIRGNQSIIVGDDKQLPPTRFFNKIAEEDDEDGKENLAADLESILGLFSRWKAPRRMLRWHYRSRHESLITVSNREFYDNKLQLFPSPDAARAKVGLVFHHHPNTVYDRGVSRKNQDEANIVAKRVMEHARSHSDLTLGVATFSASQREAIQDALEILRREDPSCEDTFFNPNSQEPFFVKNLENVQGDERDIIFISVGYGRDANGAHKMNFGPLNQDGGERRLNVLITRARWRCEVFTNLNADDINISPTSPQGVVALQRYLKYAQTGKLDVPELDADREAGSPFEEEVADTLRELNFQVDHQIGSAGYFIDLGIRDPEHPGRYLLGIECDGAAYHSARSARDRDRLRQQVLEDLGWSIHRIWSTAWFKNPQTELKKVVEAIEKAKTYRPPTPDPSSEITPEPEVINPPEPEPSENSPTENYELAELVITDGRDLHEVPSYRMADWIKRVVDVESPVHSDEVARRVTRAAGVNRIGDRIQRALKTGARHASQSGSIKIKEGFYYSPVQREVAVRDRTTLPTISRKLDLVAPEEIETAIKLIASNSLGIERGDLPREVCRQLGLGAVRRDRQKTVEIIADRMVERGELMQKGNSLVVT